MHNLLDLPQDIILEIFAWLAVEDILRTRQVCQQLFSASKDPWVWANAYQGLHRRIPQPNYIPGRDLATLAIQSERSVIRMRRLERNWTSETPHIYRQRQFKWSQKERSPELSRIELLPGGRWVFVQSMASIMIWDLDAEDILSSGTEVVSYSELVFASGMSIDTLELPSACHMLELDRARYGTQRVSIRLRRIEFNEGSPTCTLLRSFQPPYAITTLALRKNQIAFALWDVPVTVVCDWTKSRDDAFFGQSVQDTEQPNWRSDIVRLLPGSQLLVLQGLSVRIHDISSLDTTLYHVDAAPIQSTAVWSFSAHDSFAIHNFIRAGPKIGRVQIHEFSKDDNNLRHASCLFSFSTLVEHFRFWIPRRNGQVPSAIDYMHLPGRAQYSSSMIGTFRGLSLDEGHNFNLLSYAEELRYPDNAMPYSKCNSSVIRQVPLGTIYHDTEHLYLGGLDEFSGRACLVFTSGWGLPSKSIDVFDFAP